MILLLRSKHKSKYEVFVGQTIRFDQRIQTGSICALIISQRPIMICILSQIIERNEMLPLTVMVVRLAR